VDAPKTIQEAGQTVVIAEMVAQTGVITEMIAQTVEEKETSPVMVGITAATTGAGHKAVEVGVVAPTVLPKGAPPGIPTVVGAAQMVVAAQTVVQTTARMETESPTLTVTSGRVAVMAPPEVRVGRVSRARSSTRRRITLATESVV
jgi:putative Ca2+/H+ antiporter (TMEM165/GDT1 family)